MKPIVLTVAFYKHDHDIRVEVFKGMDTHDVKAAAVECLHMGIDDINSSGTMDGDWAYDATIFLLKPDSITGGYLASLQEAIDFFDPFADELYWHLDIGDESYSFSLIGDHKQVVKTHEID